MSDVTIYHPELGVQESVPEESVPHHRRAGWWLLADWQESEARKAEREARADEAAASKPSTGKGEK